jgi:hypothetical protein
MRPAMERAVAGGLAFICLDFTHGDISALR